MVMVKEALGEQCYYGRSHVGARARQVPYHRRRPNGSPPPARRVMTSLGDDEQLWSRAREGDGEACEAFWARHYMTAWRAAQRVLGRPEDIIDAVQETCLELFRFVTGTGSRRRVPPDAAGAAAWIVRTAYHKAVGIWRESRREPVGLGDHLDARQESPWETRPMSVEEIVISLDEDQAMRHLLARLDASDARLLALWFETQSGTAIAQQLGIDPSTAMRRVRALIVRVTDMAREAGLPVPPKVTGVDDAVARVVSILTRPPAEIRRRGFVTKKDIFEWVLIAEDTTLDRIIAELEALGWLACNGQRGRACRYNLTGAPGAEHERA